MVWEYVEDAWEFLIEGFFYIFTFEWVGDVGEGFSAAFEDLGELSIYGLIFGILTAGLNWLLRKYLLYPFTERLSTLNATITIVVTLIGSFIAGYFLGKYFENT